MDGDGETTKVAIQDSAPVAAPATDIMESKKSWSDDQVDMPVKGREISESAAATPYVKGETFSDAVPEAEKAPAIVTEAQAKPLVADYKAEAALVIEVKEVDEIKAVVDAASPTEQPAPSVEKLADEIGSEDMKDELNVAMDSALLL